MSGGELTTTFEAVMTKSTQAAEVKGLYESILSYLEAQKKPFIEYENSDSSQKEAYQRAVNKYETVRGIYNNQGRNGNENYTGIASSGDSFEMPRMTLGSILNGSKFEFPNKRDYRANRSHYIKPKVLADQEVQILSKLGKIFGDKKNEAANILYKDVPKFISPEIQREIAQLDFPSGVDQWEPAYVKIAKASLAVKLVNPGYIDRQIKIVNRMMKSKNPLDPRTKLGRLLHDVLKI